MLFHFDCDRVDHLDHYRAVALKLGSMTIIGIDPSMRNTALVAIKDGVVVDSLLIETEKTKVKSVRASSDTVARCRTLHRGVTDFIFRNSPENHVGLVIIAETPSGSKSSAGIKSYGISCMLLGSLGSVIEVTPEEVKVGTVGSKTASKQEMMAWAYEQHPEAGWDKNKDGSLKNKNEHLADAIAVVYAGMELPEFQRLKQFL